MLLQPGTVFQPNPLHINHCFIFNVTIINDSNGRKLIMLENYIFKNNFVDRIIAPISCGVIVDYLNEDIVM